MSKFKIILTGIFVLCIIAGVIAFATFKGGSTTTELPQITIWGTFDKTMFDAYITKLREDQGQDLKVLYYQIADADFDDTFIKALAKGQGPDAILIPQDKIYKHEDKIVQIPYTAYPQRDYQSNFIRQADLYLGTNGINAIPFIIDPIVMYWNKDIFTNAGIAKPPKYWEDFTELNKKLTVKDVNSNIRKSAIALGEFSNIAHAREIFGTLLLQYGNPVTFRYSNGVMGSALGSRAYEGIKTSEPVLNFYTQFSNPSSANYSWNRSLSNSKSAFLSGTLATYFGFASEAKDIRRKNSNLDFDISPIPQIKVANNRATYGDMYGFSILKSSANQNATFSILNTITDATTLPILMNLSYLPPVRRDMITAGTTDPYLSIFFDSALISRGWLDTGRIDSNKIFQWIVENVTSGKANTATSLQSGSDEFDIILQNI